MGKINSSQLKTFLTDYIERSETIILEEGSEKNEIFKIAEKHGILLKNSNDLAGFKTVYAFTDKPNANGAVLPKKELLRALPTLVGKPIDIDHNRKYVIGYYIDYKYIHKTGTIIAYGIFFKSNFAEEWEEAKKLFKEKKLATSFEIWSPKNKRKYKEDGTYELYDMEIAGGALIYKEQPAFKDAKVLEIAKKNIENCSCDLVYAKKEYKEEELICLARLDSMFKIKCKNCERDFEVYDNNANYFKCPYCQSALDREGNVISLKTEGSIKIACPSCRGFEWAMTEENEKYNKMKCLSCGKEYKFIFADNNDELLKNLVFVLEKSTSCVACGASIKYVFYSNQEKVTIECPVCKLKYELDIEKPFKNKKITKIEKASVEGGKNMEIKVMTDKFHRYVEVDEKNWEEFVQQLLDAVEELLENMEEAKKLTYQERKKLPDNAFAVIIRVKNKRTGGIRKIRMFPIHDEAHVRNALARLNQEKVVNTLKQYKISKDKVLRKILQRAKELKMYALLLRHEEDCKRLGISIPKMVEKSSVDIKRKRLLYKYKELRKQSKEKEIEVSSVVENMYEKRKKAVLKLRELRKKIKEEIEKAQKEAEEKVKFYIENAKKIIERRAVLGEYAENMTDEQILDDKEFEIAKLKKENDELRKASMETASDKVGSVSVDDALLEIRKKIDERAFGRRAN